MKLLILECSAEELRANRTVADCLIDSLNTFTNSLFGVDINLSNVGGDSDDEEALENP